jgi:hypothetical protein
MQMLFRQISAVEGGTAAAGAAAAAVPADQAAAQPAQSADAAPHPTRNESRAAATASVPKRLADGSPVAPGRGPGSAPGTPGVNSPSPLATAPWQPPAPGAVAGSQTRPRAAVQAQPPPPRMPPPQSTSTVPAGVYMLAARAPGQPMQYAGVAVTAAAAAGSPAGAALMGVPQRAVYAFPDGSFSVPGPYAAYGHPATLVSLGGGTGAPGVLALAPSTLMAADHLARVARSGTEASHAASAQPPPAQPR